MKRIILTLSCIISVIWLMPMFIHAESSYPTYQEFSNYFNSIYDEEITQDLYNNITNMWNVHPDYVLYTCTRDYIFNSNALCFYIGSGSRGITVSGNTVNLIGGSYCFRYKNSPYQYSSVSNSYTAYIGGDYNGLYFGTKQEFMDTWNAIDYDTVYYSPLIPNVDFSVVLNTSGVPVNDINSTEYNAFNVNINSNVGTDYNIQIGYKVHVPNKMALGVNNNGTAYYSALTYNNAVFENVYALQDNQVAFTGSVNSSLFEWTRQEVPSNDWNIVNSLQGNTAFINGSIMAYNDTMSYILPLYGKKLEIFMRYYVIQDNQIIVGAWSHWNNIYPSQYTQELPANYIPYHDVPGYQNTNNNTEYQDNDNTVNSIGTSTGQNVTVYNNSVPNYPDYPTIVTYNHDNILLQTIDTAKQLPQFFGDFSNFLAAAFVFIPSEIWTIIGFGFLCSIFVMIVKVL